MKTRITVMTFLMAVLVLPGLAQIPYTSTSVKLTVNGTSTLHEWESDVTKVEWKGSFTADAGLVKEVADVTVRIPVKSIKSTHGKMMDSKTYDAFDADKNPYISFKMSNAVITGERGNQTIQAEGTLTMAGKTKQITITVKVKGLANGDLQLTGSKKLNMREFSMDPPTAMMGAIKVGEDVTINFDLTVSPAKQLTNESTH